MNDAIKNDDSIIKSNRLIKIFWSIEVALAIAFVLNIVGGAKSWTTVSIVVVMASLSSVLFLAKANKVETASTVIIILLAIYTTIMMWLFGGLRGNAVYTFPCLLVFSAALGNRKLFLILLAFLVANILALGYANSSGWIENSVAKSNLTGALVFSTIILVVAYNIWLIIGDMHRSLGNLQKEVDRVNRSEQLVQRLVHHDTLTGLPNRTLAKIRFEHARLTSSRSSSLLCLMFLDLDNFKTINDSFGHSSGDQFLTTVADRLSATLRNADTICRLGGDEFLIILEAIASEKQIAPIAEKVLLEIQKPVKIAGIDVTATVSIGISIAPQDGENFETICRKADLAMYHAKEIGRNSYCFYNDEFEKNAEQDIQMLSDMRAAVANNEFELHYQPKIDLENGQIIGAEALLRWRHPKLGNIPPLDFIPLAESSGLIVELGEWIIDEACRECEKWTSLGFDNLSVAVNVSAMQLKRGNLVAVIKKVLAKYDLHPSKLELELTESTLIDDSQKQKSLLSELREIGIDLSIDDFGTGYSNLGYLKKMEVGILKIDRSFVSKLLDNEQDRAIIQAISQMASSLKLKIVAEGVENYQTVEVLRQLNCDYGQGYFWAPALPSDEFIDYVNSTKTPQKQQDKLETS